MAIVTLSEIPCSRKILRKTLDHFKNDGVVVSNLDKINVRNKIYLLVSGKEARLFGVVSCSLTRKSINVVLRSRKALLLFFSGLRPSFNELQAIQCTGPGQALSYPFPLENYANDENNVKTTRVGLDPTFPLAQLSNYTRPLPLGKKHTRSNE